MSASGGTWSATAATTWRSRTRRSRSAAEHGQGLGISVAALLEPTVERRSADCGLGEQRLVGRPSREAMLRLAPLVACLLIAVSACRPAAPAASTAETALVRMAWADVGVPTPFRVSAAGPGGAVLLSLMYDTLTWKDERGIIPWLATAWDVSPDGLEVTF